MIDASPPIIPSTMDRLSDDDQNRLARILEECMLGLENGEAFDVEKLVGEHPELAEPLRRCLASLQTLHDAVQDLNETLPGDTGEVFGHLGEFELNQVIGRGGMGVVYSAWQSSLNRQVAIKVMQSGSISHPNRLRRFQLEAQSAARLQHPNIVPIYAVGEESGVHYYAMQLIDGDSLEHCDVSQWEARNYGPLVDAAIDIGRALQHAHECGIVHRDIKPSNILLDSTGKVWITDFGLAHRLDGNSMTQSGDVLGTANYMSPEQALGRPVDERTDIYSLAATLYEMATGRPAFPGARLQDILRKIESEEPVSPRQIKPSIPIDLETILLKGMSKDREDRYINAKAMVDDLIAFRDGLPIRGRRPTLAKIASKWIARHKLPFVMGLAGIAVALVVSLCALAKISSTKNRLTQALNTSQTYLKNSNENYWQARKLLDRWNEKWIPQLAAIPSAHEARSAMLEDTIRFYESFLHQSELDPQLEPDLVSTRIKLGQAYARAGKLELAVELLEKLLGDADSSLSSLEVHGRPLAIAMNDLGLTHLRLNQLERAESMIRKSLLCYEQITSPELTEPAAQLDLAAVHLNLARVLHKTGQLDESLTHVASAEQLLRAMLNTKSRDVEVVSKLALVLDHKAVCLENSDPASALQSAREASLFHAQLMSGYNPRWDWLQASGASAHNRGVLQLKSGELERSIQSLHEAVDARSKVCVLNPTHADSWLELATSQNALAMCEFQNGQASSASSRIAEAAHLLKTQIDTNGSEDIRVRSALVGLLMNWVRVGPVDQGRDRFGSQIKSFLDFLENDIESHSWTQVLPLRQQLNTLKTYLVTPRSDTEVQS